MPLATRSRYRRTSLTVPAAITIVPGSHTSASALMSLSGSADSLRSTNRMFGLADTDSDGTKHVGRRVVADEGGEGIAKSRAALKGCVHHLLPFGLISCRPRCPVG